MAERCFWGALCGLDLDLVNEYQPTIEASNMVEASDMVWCRPVFGAPHTNSGCGWNIIRQAEILSNGHYFQQQLYSSLYHYKRK